MTQKLLICCEVLIRTVQKLCFALLLWKIIICSYHSFMNVAVILHHKLPCEIHHIQRK